MAAKSPAVPVTMTAIEICEPGPPEVLQPTQRPVPEIGPRDVLIRVVAAGVNRPDVLQRKGLYPPPPGTTDIPGLELSGEVVRVGAEVSEFAVGARVVPSLPVAGTHSTRLCLLCSACRCRPR